MSTLVPRDRVQASILDALQMDDDGLGVVDLADSLRQFLRINIPDDGSDTSTWPDRIVCFWNGTRAGYFNEYGELRARAARTTTVAFRAMAASGAGTSQAILQVTNSGQSTTYLSVSGTTITLNGALDHDGSTAGFFGATPTTKPTVTGSRGGNAALASLLSALATLGLITDSSSA